MINHRASFNRRIVELADAGVPVLTEPSGVWKDPCYRVEWLDAMLPRGAGLWARNVRVHVRGTGGTFETEARLERLMTGLGLVARGSVATVDLYDYTTTPSNPPKIGTFKVERSSRGVSVIPPPSDSPDMRHLVLNLVIVHP